MARGNKSRGSWRVNVEWCDKCKKIVCECKSVRVTADGTQGMQRGVSATNG